MSATVLYMSVSLDGFVAGPNAGPGNGLGDGGERLHEWLQLRRADPGSGVPGRPAGVNGQLFDEFMAAGAVVAGRGTFEPAGGWGGDHHWSRGTGACAARARITHRFQARHRAGGAKPARLECCL